MLYSVRDGEREKVVGTHTDRATAKNHMKTNKKSIVAEKRDH